LSVCPPYLPEVTPFGCHIFRPPEEAADEKIFRSDEEMLEILYELLCMHPKDFFFTGNPGMCETLVDVH
jgi:hypothetical protein